MQIVIDINHQLKEKQKELLKGAKHLKNLAPLLQELGARFENSTRMRFMEEKAPDGSAWQALKKETIARKKRNKNKILTEFGDLSKSITYHAANVYVAIGTPEKKGVFLQEGTKHMPARPFLGISKQDKKDMLSAMNKFIAEAL